jgi:hypothetical protein
VGRREDGRGKIWCMGKMWRRTEVRGRGGKARVRGRWEREWCVGKMESRAGVRGK